MARQAWRNGDTAQCGASRVRIAAIGGGRAWVVGGGLYGAWSIWVDIAQLRRARESEWENEGGRVRRDETSAAETAQRGHAAKDNSAGSA